MLMSPVKGDRTDVHEKDTVNQHRKSAQKPSLRTTQTKGHLHSSTDPSHCS